MTINCTTDPLERITLWISEARLEHGLSQRQLDAMSGVSAPAIRKAGRGAHIDPALLILLGGAFIVLDVSRPPYFEHDVDVLLRQAAREPSWERSAA